MGQDILAFVSNSSEMNHAKSDEVRSQDQIDKNQ